jgi:hypothetical protein
MGTRPTPDQEQARRQEIQQLWQWCLCEEERVLDGDPGKQLAEFEDNFVFGPLFVVSDAVLGKPDNYGGLLICCGRQIQSMRSCAD